MISTLFWVAVGAVVGWAIPQPAWAKPIVDKVGTWIETVKKVLGQGVR